MNIDAGVAIAALALIVSVFAALAPWWAKGRAFLTIRLEQFRAEFVPGTMLPEERIIVENHGPSNAHNATLEVSPSQDAVTYMGNALAWHQIVAGQQVHLPLAIEFGQERPNTATLRWEDGRIGRRHRSETFILTAQKLL